MIAAQHGRMLLLLALLPWVGTSVVAQTANTELVKVVKLQSIDLPAFLLNGSIGAQSGTPPSQNSTSFGKRSRRYVVPDSFNESSSISLSDAMKLPEERAGMKLSQWVVCSWLVANISAADAMTNGNSVFLDRISEVLRTVQNLAPQQVYAVAAANVTLGFTFTGIKGGSLTQPAAAALTRVAADMAGGFNETLIAVSTDAPPSTAAPALAFESIVRDGAAIIDKVINKDGTGQPAAAPAGRLLLQHAAHVPGAVQQAQHLELWANLSPPRRMLQAQAAAAPPPTPGSSPTGAADPLPVWLSYTRVAPGNTTALMTELCLACNITTNIPLGTDFATKPCGRAVQAALVGAGLTLDDNSYHQYLNDAPSLSLSVRLAIGLTEAQVAAGTGRRLTDWLAQNETVRAVAGMYAPGAVVSWLHAPQLVDFKKGGRYQPSAFTPAAAAGVAVGGAVVLCSIVLLAAWLVYRSRRRRQGLGPAADGKDDGIDSQASSSSGRRRRRQGAKRRYLLPELPRPDSNIAPPAAAVSADSLSTSAAVADDTEMTPDQIRPQLRSLGDSVTSAVRYELSDDEEGDQAGTSAGPAVAAAGAAGVAAAGVAAGAAGGGSTSGGTSSSGGQSSAAANRRGVLDARAALMAEYQQKGQLGTAAAAKAGVNCHAAAAGIELMPCAVSPELAAAADICSALGPEELSLAVPAAATATVGAAAATAAAGQPHSGMEPGLLQPVDERAAAASAAAVAAAAALPMAGAVTVGSRRASPFASSYNFVGLAGTAAAAAAPPPGATATQQDPAAVAAAMAAESAKAVSLPPQSPLPLEAVVAGTGAQRQLAAPAAATAAVTATVTATATATASAGQHLQEITAAGSSCSSHNNSSSSGSQCAAVSPCVVATSGRPLDQPPHSSSNSCYSSLPCYSPSPNQSPAGSCASSPLPPVAGSKGVGLQQLVSISPKRAAPCNNQLGVDSRNGVHGLLPATESQCPSVLQQPTDSDVSTLQLSSSLSVTQSMLQPNSTFGSTDPQSGGSYRRGTPKQGWSWGGTQAV